MLNNQRYTAICIVITALMMVAGCSSTTEKTQHSGYNSERSIPASDSSHTTVRMQPDSEDTDSMESGKTSMTHLQEGTGNYLGTPSTNQQNDSIEQAGVSLNFKDMDLQAFIQAILGEALGVNYIIDPTVNGKVNIQTPHPVPKDELIGVLEEILTLNGAALTYVNNTYRVVSSAAAAQLPQTVRVKQLQGQGYGLQIVPLRYIGAVEMAQIIQPSIKTQGVVYTDKRRNLLILSGSEAMLNSLLDMISIFDVDWLSGKSVSLYQLTHADPKTLVNDLEAALDGQNGEFFNGIVKLIPIDRVNGVLIVSTTESYRDELLTWISRLDVSNDQVDKRLFVYPLQNKKAADVANLLNSIFSDESLDAANSSIPKASVMPSDTAVVISADTDTDASSESERDRERGGSVPKRPGSFYSNSSGVRIIADELSNHLVILGTSQDYEMVVSAIEKLDILPKQVLIEATILEVSLSGELSYGVEWFFKNGPIDTNKKGRGQLSLGSDGISSITPGFSYSIVDSMGDIRFVLNALESETNVEVLSSPSIMVMDNNSALINVGDEIPVPSRQSTSNIDPTAPTVNEIEYRNTGISLDVSPRINSGGLVTLEVKQEVSDAVTTTTSGIDAPTIQQRIIESTVVIQSGQSVILGGLIRDKSEEGVSGVPLLSRVPVLGNLFSQTSNNNRRTELLIILTPRVIANATEAQAITDEYRNKLVQPMSMQK